MTAEPFVLFTEADLKTFFAWPCVVLGGVGLAFSAILGGFGLRVAVRTKLETAASVFGRGVAGVGSVIAFLVSALMLWGGIVMLGGLSERWFAVFFVIAGLAFAFLAIEFGIGGALYVRAHRTFATRALSIASFVLVPVFALVALCALFIGAVAFIHPQ